MSSEYQCHGAMVQGRYFQLTSDLADAVLETCEGTAHMLKAMPWCHRVTAACFICIVFAPNIFSEDSPVVPLWQRPAIVIGDEDIYAYKVSVSLTGCGNSLVTSSPKQLVCYDRTDGSVKWKYPFGDDLYKVEYGQEGSGAARMDRVFINGHVVLEKDKVVIVDIANRATWFDLIEGRPISRLAFPRASGAVFGSLKGPAIHGAGRVSFSLKHSQILLVDSGEPERFKTVDASPDRVGTPPVAVNHGELYTGGNGLLYFDVDSNVTSKVYERPGMPVGVPKYDGGDSMYFLCGNRVVKYSVRRHCVVWDVSPSETMGLFTWLSPALIEGRLIIGSSADQTLYCVDVNNGKVLWRKKYEGYFAGHPVEFGGYVVYAMTSGELRFYDLSTGFEAHVVEGGTILSWSSRPLVCSDGILYYASADRVIAYSAKHPEW